MRHKIEERGLQQQIQVDSAGTGDWHIGKPPHEGTRKLLDSYQISYANMAARQFGSADFDQFDYIVCMDDSNVANVRKITGGAEADIMKFMDLLPNESLREVPDPYFTGNFEEVYKLVEAGCNVLLEQIQKDHSLA